MNILRSGCAHKGRRDNQQDAHKWSTEDEGFIIHGGVLAVVADGMGGEKFGEIASSIAVDVIVDEYERKTESESIPEALYRSVIAANNAVWEMAKEKNCAGMSGTTVSAAVIHSSGLYWISAGDSRIYLFSREGIRLLTSDHNMGRDLDFQAVQGLISREYALSHPDRNALTSFVGIHKLEQLEKNSVPLHIEPDTFVLLCSDGLYGSVEEKDMVSIISRYARKNPFSIPDRLIDAALSKGSGHQDNMTAVVMAFTDGCLKKKYYRDWFLWGASSVIVIVFLLAIVWIFFFYGKPLL